MNEKHQETVTPEARLILTVPAYSFVVALHLDLLAGPTRQLFQPNLCQGRTRGNKRCATWHHYITFLTGFQS